MPNVGTVEVKKLTFPVAGNKRSTVVELLGCYFGFATREHGLTSEQIDSSWRSFDDPNVTYKAGIDTCVQYLHKCHTPFICNIHACEEDNGGTKNKFIQVSLWNQHGAAIKDPIFTQLAKYKVALYNHDTGKMSTPKSLERTEQRSYIETNINQSDCNQEVDRDLKAVIDENFRINPEANLGYKYSILFFDREGNLIVPNKF